MTYYNSQVEKLYMDFVGRGKLGLLDERFSEEMFKGRWEQVMTSLSTQIMGTGITFSSVNATYDLLNGQIHVTNSAYNGKFEKIFIEGTSIERHTLKTCRTVKFDDLDIVGDYWIFHITNDKETILVAAPIIIPTPFFPICVTGTFGLYVLTKDRNKFWNDAAKQKEIMKELKNYGFTNFYNTPICSGESIPIQDPKDAATVSTGTINF